MSELAANFHFLRPWWLLAICALPLLWHALARGGADARAWRGAVDAHLLEHLLVRGEGAGPQRGPRLLAVFAWLVACLAIAGPAWERMPQPLYKNHAARVFALELSASMLAQDVKPSRYERARFKLNDMLAHSGDAQTALIAYAGDAFVVAPLTDDANTVVNLVDALDPSVMPVGGNATARAIDQAVELIKQAGAGTGDIVLLADSASADAVDAARRAYAAGVRVSVLEVGNAQGAPVPLPQGGFLKNAAGEIVLPKMDAESLTALAKAGGGRAVAATSDASDVDQLLAAAQAADVAQSQAATATTPRFLDRGPWLLWLLLPIAACGFRRGWLLMVPLVVLAHSNTAQAFSWVDLWQRPDQQAQAQLDAGRARQAQSLAQSPDLRGAAAYRAGDFAAAASSFDEARDAQAQYNRGNALAKQGMYPEAIAAYDAALKQNPDLADAAANKAAVEAWLKRQQESKDQQKQSQDHQGHQQNQDGAGTPSGDRAQQQSDKQQGDQQQAQDRSQSGKQEQQQSSADQSQQDTSGKQDGKQSDNASGQQTQSREADQQAQQQFSDKIDKAVQQEAGKGDKKPQPVRLGSNDDGKPRDEHEQAMQQWIERVPDDPGGLLRRKFQLEYQRRQNHNAGRGGE